MSIVGYYKFLDKEYAKLKEMKENGATPEEIKEQELNILRLEDEERDWLQDAAE